MMLDKLIWEQNFTMIMYSRNGMHRHRLDCPLEISHSDCTVRLENSQGDKICCTMKFSTTGTRCVNDAESVRDGILKRLEHTFLLKGYLMKQIGSCSLKCTNPPEGSLRPVTKPVGIAWRIEDETKKVPANSLESLEFLFSEMFANDSLSGLADRIEKRADFSAEMADFIYNWIDFNKLYNPDGENKSEPCLIRKFTANLEREGHIDTIYGRNKPCFDKLGKMNITNHKGDRSLSAELQQALDSHDKQDIVCKSLQCVYQIRNGAFHAGSFEIPDLPMINNFVFEVICHDILKTFESCGLTSLYGDEDV